MATAVEAIGNWVIAVTTTASRPTTLLAPVRYHRLS